MSQGLPEPMKLELKDNTPIPVQKTMRIRGVEEPIPNNFKDFDPKQIQEWSDCAVIIYGRRRTGKSTAMRHFVYTNKKLWDEVYLFSETAYLQPGLFDFVPEDHQYTGFDVEKLEELLGAQEADVDHKLKNGQEKAIKHLLFLFDDVISNDKIRHTPAFNGLFTKGRHIRSSVIVLTQSIGGQNGIPKVIRDNVDLCISFFPHNALDRESMVERYLSIKDKKIGDQILKDITFEEYTAIAVLLAKNGKEYEDYVFKYKAPEKTPKFMIGSKTQKDVPMKSFDPRAKGLSFNNKFSIKTEVEDFEDNRIKF